MKLPYTIVLVLVVLLASCKKDTKSEAPVVSPPIETPKDTSKKSESSLSFSFKALANNTPLVMTNKGYVNAGEDNFTVSLFNYYISNIRLKRADGFEYAEPESYHLVRHGEGKTTFTVSNLPEGNYTSMEFLIGVDAARNTSGAQTGDLDVSNNMFWNWNQGYVFFKLEGSYLAKNATTEAQYAIHIGGFEGKNNNIRTCSFNLGTPVIAKKGVVSKIYLNTIVDEIFKNPSTIAIDDYFAASGEAGMRLVADNYPDMIVVDKVEN